MARPYAQMDHLTAAPTPAPVRRLDKAPYVGQWLTAHIAPLVRAGRTLDHAVASANAKLQQDVRTAAPVHFVTRWSAYMDEVKPAFEDYVVEHARLRRQYDYWYASRPWAPRPEPAVRYASVPPPGPVRNWYNRPSDRNPPPYRPPRTNFAANFSRTPTPAPGPQTNDTPNQDDRVRLLEDALGTLLQLHPQSAAALSSAVLTPATLQPDQSSQC